MNGSQEINPSGEGSEKKNKKISGDLDDLEAEKKKMKTSLEKSSDEKKEDLEDVKMKSCSDDDMELPYMPLCDSSDEELTESEIAEYKEYRKQMISSGGFDIVRCPPFFPCTLSPLTSVKEGDETYIELCHFSNLAIEDYNSRNGTHFQFVKYVKAVAALCAGMKYYITFEAKEPSPQDDDDAPTTTFQALVYDGIPNVYVILVRQKSDATEEDNKILLK